MASSGEAYYHLFQSQWYHPSPNSIEHFLIQAVWKSMGYNSYVEEFILPATTFTYRIEWVPDHIIRLCLCQLYCFYPWGIKTWVSLLANVAWNFHFSLVTLTSTLLRLSPQMKMSHPKEVCWDMIHWCNNDGKIRSLQLCTWICSYYVKFAIQLRIILDYYRVYYKNM